MKRRLTLTKRYLLLISAVMIVFIGATLAITTKVMKGGMAQLFRQRIDRAVTVLAQYESAHALARSQELDAVLSSPRFIAAVETEDSATIAQEAPVYQKILGAEVLCIVNNHGKPTYFHGADPREIGELTQLTVNATSGSIRYLSIDSKMYEFTVSEIASGAGPLGWMLAGKEYSSAMARDLKRLTGLDVIVAQDQLVLGATESQITKHLTENPALLKTILSSGQEGNCTVNGEDVMVSILSASSSGATIGFVGSLDEYVAPIRSQILLYLFMLAVGGGIFAMATIYVLTERQIGRQVSHLVVAAELIAAGSLDTPIKPLSTDELGFLADEMETMRARIVADRSALQAAHLEKVKTEKVTAIGSMATGIIHDFKNPMMIIRGTVELLQRKQGDPERLHRSCTTIIEQVDRMRDLTQDILDFSRGRVQLTIAPVDLREYFAAISAFHEPAFSLAGIRCTFAGTEVTAGIDRHRFRRVIDNLLNNAREALRPGNTVSVNWQYAKERLVVQVTDDGPGIPADIRDRLFEPFVTSNKEGGTGLGLAISRKIIEDHGGTIAVQSSAETGTTFSISLPATVVSPHHKFEPAGIEGV